MSAGLMWQRYILLRLLLVLPLRLGLLHQPRPASRPVSSAAAWRAGAGAAAADIFKRHRPVRPVGGRSILGCVPQILGNAIALAFGKAATHHDLFAVANRALLITEDVLHHPARLSEQRGGRASDCNQ